VGVGAPTTRKVPATRAAKNPYWWNTPLRRGLGGTRGWAEAGGGW
jgi:hypothetical protein